MVFGSQSPCRLVWIRKHRPGRREGHCAQCNSVVSKSPDWEIRNILSALYPDGPEELSQPRAIRILLGPGARATDKLCRRQAFRARLLSRPNSCAQADGWRNRLIFCVGRLLPSHRFRFLFASPSTMRTASQNSAAELLAISSIASKEP